MTKFNPWQTEGKYIFTQYNFMNQQVDYLIREVMGDDVYYGELVMHKLTQEQRESITPRAPAFALSDQETQSLMDNLWKCGFRPTEARGSAGSMEAQSKHLEDMRKIAFNKLKIDKEK